MTSGKKVRDTVDNYISIKKEDSYTLLKQKTKEEKAVILKLCQGGSDPRHKSCSHDWKEFKESGCKRNKIYYYCPCGLVCTVKVGGAYSTSCFKTFIGETTPAIEKGLCCGDKRMAMDCKECEEKKNVV